MSVRNYTTVKELAQELKVHPKTARRYLDSMEEAGIGLVRTDESRPEGPSHQLVYRFSREWRKKHGFL